MLYLRVVKGTVNFIVLLLAFGVDAGDRLVLVVFSSPGNISVSDQMQATKVRGIPRGMEPRVGSPSGSPPGPEAIVLNISPLCVPPPQSDRSVHFTLIFLQEKQFHCHVLCDSQKRSCIWGSLLNSSQCPPFSSLLLFCQNVILNWFFHKFCHILCVLASMSELTPHPQEHSLFTDVFSFHTFHVVKVPAEN